MRLLPSWMNPIRRLPSVLKASLMSPATFGLGDAGLRGSLLLGLFSLALIWLGAWYIAHEDTVRTEAAAYRDTANLARAFEEHIIRLLKAHDQIILFARSSYVRDSARFSLAQWAREQQFGTDAALQIALIDKAGILVDSNLAMPAGRLDLRDREHFRVHV